MFGSVAAGLSLVTPQSVLAAEHRAKALVLSCIDFRFIGAEQSFLHDQHLDQSYDWVALAGASLALTGFPQAAEADAFWDQLQLAKELHHTEKVIILDHQDCGAYASRFTADLAQNPIQEKQIHRDYLDQAFWQIKQRHPDLEVELYFVLLNHDVLPIAPKPLAISIDDQASL